MDENHVYDLQFPFSGFCSTCICRIPFVHTQQKLPHINSYCWIYTLNQKSKYLIIHCFQTYYKQSYLYNAQLTYPCVLWVSPPCSFNTIEAKL